MDKFAPSPIAARRFQRAEAGLRLVAPLAVVVRLVLLLSSRTAEACGDHCGSLMDLCLQDSDCGQGLYCSCCPAAADFLKRCYRSQASEITYDSLPFNKYAWLTTHNSYAWTGAPELTGPRVTFCNQEDYVADQLINGVRGLMLDTYEFDGDVWLCHAPNGACEDIFTFEPLGRTLEVIASFLAANPSEVITLFLEDYVTTPGRLSNAFDAAGLKNYWFAPGSMPQNGGDWPTVKQMVDNNWRLLVFTSRTEKESSEGIAYQWKYVLENQYGDGGEVAGECSNRDESAALNDTSKSLILLNYFSTVPIEELACKENAGLETDMLPVCHDAAGGRWANYLAVDFYKRSQGSGAFGATDYLNVHMTS